MHMHQHNDEIHIYTSKLGFNWYLCSFYANCSQETYHPILKVWDLHRAKKGAAFCKKTYAYRLQQSYKQTVQPTQIMDAINSVCSTMIIHAT